MKLWAETQGKLSKLRDAPIDVLNIWCVDHNGLGAPVSIGSCWDFCFVARRGSIIVMRDIGAYLKVHREYWLGADIIHMLLRDRDQVATLLNYEE